MEHGIPAAFLEVLPADPAEQLDIACRLASLAFSTKASALETENVQLRQGLMQRQSQVKALERRVHDLEGENSTVREELTKLSSEKAALLSTIKRLNRDIARLDTFKRNLLQTLNDEDVEGGGEPALLTAAGSPTGGGSLPSYMNSAGTAFGSTPMLAKGGSAPSGSPKLDGKEFFRQARARLPYEVFSEFLANIKRLNQHSQTRQQTLDRARDLFGGENGDLYFAFEGLLSRHMP